FSKPIWRTRLKGITLTVFSSGVIIYETTDETLSLPAINLFLATVSIRGSYIEPVSRWDFVDVWIGAQGSLSSWGGKIRKERLDLRTGFKIDPRHVASSIDLLPRLDNHEEAAGLLRLLHSAISHNLATELLQSLTLSWTV